MGTEIQTVKSQMTLGYFGVTDKAVLGKKSQDYCEITIEKSKIIFTVKGIYSLPDVKDKELVKDFYGMKSYEEVEKFIRNRSRCEIIYNYVFDYIMENSEIISYPSKVSENIEQQIEYMSEEAKAEGMTMEEYLDIIGLSINDIKNSIIEYYSQHIIAEAVLDKEDKMIDQQKIEELQDNKSVKSEDYQEKYFELLLNVLRDVIVESTQVVD